MWRLFRTFTAFIGGTILTYILVLVGAFSFWSFVPTPDPTKKIAATVFLIIGPVIALIGGVWLAAWAARGRAPWPATAWARGREIRRQAMAAAAATPVPAASAAERVVGWLFTALGGGGIAIGFAGLFIFWGNGDPWLKIPMLHLLPVFMLAVVGLLGPAFLGGIGLLRGRVWGRPVVTVTAILMLLLVPIGTIAGIAALIVLHGHRLRRKARAGRATAGAPQQGNAATVTCAHLAPIEQASVASGIAVTRRGQRRAEIHCTAYAPSLHRLLTEGSPVVIEEQPAPDRSTRDPPRLVLRCTACDSWLVFDSAATAGPWSR